MDAAFKRTFLGGANYQKCSACIVDKLKRSDFEYYKKSLLLKKGPLHHVVRLSSLSKSVIRAPELTFTLAIFT